MNNIASPITAPCGSWQSPITSDLLVGESTPIDEIAVVGDESFWTERRPREGGRNVLVRWGADGTPGTPRRVTGGVGQSIFQPAWLPKSALHFVSDRSGWWNLYRQRNGAIEALHPKEGHDFRRTETIKRALEAELYFHGRMFGFTPADAIAPVEIDNLPASS
jgi:hypothetical protein